MKNQPEIKAGYVDALWRFFASLRLTVIILLTLAVLSGIGTILPQNQSPADYFRIFGPFWYQILATLDLIRQGDEPTSPPEPDPRLGALVSNLRGRPLTTAGALTFLDQGYFSGLAADPPQSTMRATSPDQALLWMVRAYLSIRRPLGFTPGRPISVLACCLALREGIAMEIRDAYDCIYEAAARWSEYLHFSGGSRFDREFLIRIDPVLEELLESELDEVAASRGR